MWGYFKVNSSSKFSSSSNFSSRLSFVLFLSFNLNAAGADFHTTAAAEVPTATNSQPDSWIVDLKDPSGKSIHETDLPGVPLVWQLQDAGATGTPIHFDGFSRELFTNHPEGWDARGLYFQIKVPPKRTVEASNILWLRDPVAIELLNKMLKISCVVFAEPDFKKEIFYGSDGQHEEALRKNFCASKSHPELNFKLMALISKKMNRFDLFAIYGALIDQLDPEYNLLLMDIHSFCHRDKNKNALQNFQREIFGHRSRLRVRAWLKSQGKQDWNSDLQAIYAGNSLVERHHDLELQIIEMLANSSYDPWTSIQWCDTQERQNQFLSRISDVRLEPVWQ